MQFVGQKGLGIHFGDQKNLHSVYSLIPVWEFCRFLPDFKHFCCQNFSLFIFSLFWGVCRAKGVRNSFWGPRKSAFCVQFNTGMRIFQACTWFLQKVLILYIGQSSMVRRNTFIGLFQKKFASPPPPIEEVGFPGFFFFIIIKYSLGFLHFFFFFCRKNL